MTKETFIKKLSEIDIQLLNREDFEYIISYILKKDSVNITSS